MNFKAETFSLGRTSPPPGELGQWASERGSWRTSDGLGDIRTEACIAPIPFLGHFAPDTREANISLKTMRL